MHDQARLFVATGAPVQPHSSDGLDGLDVEYRWVRVPNELFEHVGFSETADTPVGFCFQFGLQVPDEDICVSIYLDAHLLHPLSVSCMQPSYTTCIPCI